VMVHWVVKGLNDCWWSGCCFEGRQYEDDAELWSVRTDAPPTCFACMENYEKDRDKDQFFRVVET
jgi:hypothetical protein